MCLLGSRDRRAVYALLTRYGSAERALDHLDDRPESSLAPVSLIGQCHTQQIEAVGYFDDGFPQLLREIPDPPLLLYYRGDLDVTNVHGVAIVGSRRCSSTGVNIAQHLARELACHGIAVVSGLATGIDASAHRGAILGGEGAAKTIAVLGGGLSSIYPSTNRGLAREILDCGGLLLSEYPPFAPPRKFHFPERNRLISGLSLGIVVVEASERSGSLITARLGLEQGREVMAVPGIVGSVNSHGCHRLLKQGAALIEDTVDVLEALGLQEDDIPGKSPTCRRQLPEGELRQILESVQFEPTTLDEIAASSVASTEHIVSVLVELELEGFVQRMAEGYIRRPFG